MESDYVKRQTKVSGHQRSVDFGSFKTNGTAIAIHTLIFFIIYVVLILAVHVHIYTGCSGRLIVCSRSVRSSDFT
ncbi:hypothetical protein HS088_TW23G00622 [Tripterygium wilfordii]|uniref:Transmembrane protein n=1 Tax=Tripterygium wilfordii TaxID=458696 RepID=A0A7J7BVG7_TRIWF|nr:hypothetical protein HS088_TW23G00622 [Tripterygium wilfordii]